MNIFSRSSQDVKSLSLDIDAGSFLIHRPPTRTQLFQPQIGIKKAQLMLTNRREAFRGQSRSPNMVPFDMLGMVSF